MAEQNKENFNYYSLLHKPGWVGAEPSRYRLVSKNAFVNQIPVWIWMRWLDLERKD